LAAVASLNINAAPFQCHRARSRWPSPHHPRAAGLRSQAIISGTQNVDIGASASVNALLDTVWTAQGRVDSLASTIFSETKAVVDRR
jgi:hypothetical protein